MNNTFHSSSGGNSMVTERAMDSAKINQLFDKINDSNNLEIEERSVKNIQQKLQFKLLDPQILAVNHARQIGFLMDWLNRRQDQATQQGVQNCLNIFAKIATTEEGRMALSELGGHQIFDNLYKQTDQPTQADLLTQIMQQLVNAPASGLQPAQTPFQTLARQEQAEDFVSTFERREEPANSAVEVKRVSSQNLGFSRKEFSTQRFMNQKQQSATNVNSHVATGHVVSQMNQSQMSQRSAATSSASIPHSVQMNSHSQSSNPLHTAHMEILHKQQTLKEPCELPFIWLSEEDEKRLFDLSVQLKFGDFRTVLVATQTLSDSILLDYPVEVLLQRTDIFKSLLDLLEGGQNGPSGKTSGQQAYTNLAQQTLMNFVKRLRLLYRFIGNNTTKRSAIHSTKRTYTSALTNPEQEPAQMEFMRLSYPSTKEGIWNTEEAVSDLKKYGAQLPTERMAAAATQGSLSCRAALGLIIVKSIYMLKDTEKLGLYLQLIREATQSLIDVYRVPRNPEFSEMLHLCLFAFDSVCDFYKDQLFEEVLVRPILGHIVQYLGLLNSIAQDATKERFKLPFTETLFKNTEHLQMILRRALFSLSQTEETNHVILDFFHRIEKDLPQVNLLQKNVSASFSRAQQAYAKFCKVTAFRLNGVSGPDCSYEDMNFVDNVPQMVAAIQILDDLTFCIDMKLDFPFEHLLLDCMVYSTIVADQSPLPSDNKTDEVERLVITYLQVPQPEVRERLLRRLYQRLRVVQAFQEKSKHYVNNNYMLAKFIYRKKLLNQLINGMLINNEVANEETKLQLNIGQLIVKCLIIGYNEAGLITQKQNSLNSFLLTFQALLPQYPELIGLIDLIEENASARNCRFLRILRDLFNHEKTRREFSTSVIRGQLSKDFGDNEHRDLLASAVDLGKPQNDISTDLDLVNLNYDFTTFDIVNITSILQNARSDYQLRKSSLEQLTLLLFDCDQKRGKALFTNKAGVIDVFSFVVSELLTSYNSAKTYMGEKLVDLGPEQTLYVEQCLRFVFFAYVFFQEEPKVKQLFDRIRNFASPPARQEPAQVQEAQQFETLLNALVFFCGPSQTRKHALRLLYLIVFLPFWLKIKVIKQVVEGRGMKRQVSFVVPDFSQESFISLVPHQLQIVRMPLRDDLTLTQEQRHFISAMEAQPDVQAQEVDVLRKVAANFAGRKKDRNEKSLRDLDLNQVMRSFELLQNYLLATSSASEDLITVEVLQQIQEQMRMLPTQDFEFNFLADFLMGLNQILAVAPNLKNQKQLENIVGCLCETLKFHVLPYLYEVGLSGFDNIDEFTSPRMLFINQLLEFLCCLAQVEVMLQQRFRTPSRLQEKVLTTSLVNYLSKLYTLMKTKNEIRKKIQQFFFLFISHFETSQIQMHEVPDLLIGQISQHRMSHSFEGGALVIQSIRTLLMIHQNRIAHVQNQAGQTQESRFGFGDLTQTISLSQTTSRYLDEFVTSGWLVRFTESRDARLRCISWDLLTELFNFQMLKRNPSLAQTSLNVLLRDGELFCVKISALKFLNKLCDCLILNCDNTQAINDDIHDHCTDTRFAGADAEQVTVQALLNQVNKQGLISHIQCIFNQRDCPLLMISLLLRLLAKLVQMDFRRALPVLTQLDYWTTLVDLLSVDQLQMQDVSESRHVIAGLQKSQLAPQPYIFDQVYMTINSICEFLFESFRRDAQIAALLVKTTKLLPKLFDLIKLTLDNSASFRDPKQGKIPLQNQGLLTIFIDKVVKLLHICLLHPRDYSIELISKFLTEKPLDDVESSTPRNWVYLIKMFRLIGSKHSSYYYGHIDVKLSICRLVAEILMRLPTSSVKQHFLDETVHLFDGEKYIEQGYLEDESEIETYGGLFLLEFGQVFRALYVDQRDTRQRIGVPNEYSEHENSKIDISLCLSLLIASCDSAKMAAIEQNLFRKVIEICQENVEAIHLAELQKFSTQRGGKSQNVSHQSQMGKISKEMFESQFSRKYKFANVADLELCEREVVRMLRIIRHIFYKSGVLLLDPVFKTSGEKKMQQKSIVSQNAIPKITSAQKGKEASLADKLMELNGIIFEKLAGNQRMDTIIEEALMCMVTFASQNVRFKNTFLSPCYMLASAKKSTILKLLIECLLAQTPQSNTNEMRLLFQVLKSLAMSAEAAKEIMKQRTIEELHSKLAPVCKNEKDIKLFKNYLASYSGFLAAYASTDEGRSAVLKLKPIFELSLFILDTVTPTRTTAEVQEITPMTQLVMNQLLFLRNTSFNRTNKLHVLTDPAFLPCLLTFMSSTTQHVRVRAYTAACLWSILYNHQGVKASINTPQIKSELSLLKEEFQRQVDISKYNVYVRERAERGNPEPTLILTQDKKHEEMANARMTEFTLIALNGIAALLDF